MSDFRKETYVRKATTVMAAMAARNFNALYFEASSEAVSAICGMIPVGALVGLGGSESVLESGLVDALRKLDIDLLDRYRADVSKEEIGEMRLRSLTADVFISSANAVSADGKIVSMDGLGNRVAALLFGAKKVILIIGCKKIRPTVEECVSRIRNVAAPMNSIRYGADTPCANSGFCDESSCRPPGRICGQLAVLESSMIDGRITVVFVGEDLGF